MISILFGCLGIIVLLSIAFLFSNSRKNINWRIVFTGLGLQLLFAVFVILTPWGSLVFDAIGSFFVKIISFTYSGATFVFGPLANQSVFEQAFSEELRFEGIQDSYTYEQLHRCSLRPSEIQACLPLSPASTSL